jgi:myo-inositol-1(or 4)-monophosphatase
MPGISGEGPLRTSNFSSTSSQRAAYITDGDVRKSVHFAAAIAVCEAAGCVLSDLFGAPWGRGATGLIVAADFETHSALASRIARYFAGG